MLVLLYVASPYYAVWRFSAALRAHDAPALSARIDFGAVRGSLKQQVRDHFLGPAPKQPKKKNPLAELAASLGPTLIDTLVDAYVTPDGIAALISNPGKIKDARALPSVAAFQSGDGKGIDWSKAGHAFFTSPRDFAVEDEGIKLRFRFNGFGWKLHMIDLQLAPKS